MSAVTLGKGCVRAHACRGTAHEVILTLLARRGLARAARLRGLRRAVDVRLGEQAPELGLGDRARELPQVKGSIAGAR